MVKTKRLPLSPRLIRKSSSRYVIDNSPAALGGAWIGMSYMHKYARDQNDAGRKTGMQLRGSTFMQHLIQVNIKLQEELKQ